MSTAARPLARTGIDVLLTRCTRELVAEERRPLTPERRAAILETNEQLAGQALRTLGVAGRWLTRQALAECLSPVAKAGRTPQRAHPGKLVGDDRPRLGTMTTPKGNQP